MPSLNSKFTSILDFIEHPVNHHHAGDKPVCYLTFGVEEILQVKKNLNSWISLAKGKGFNIQILSIMEILNSFFKSNPRRDTWLNFDNGMDKDEIDELFEGLGSNVRENKIIESAILSAQSEIMNHSKPIIIITDLEAIHPYSKFGRIESNIYNQIEIPIIILYPGKLDGSSLEFLGFYPPDGNYRSKHF